MLSVGSIANVFSTPLSWLNHGHQHVQELHQDDHRPSQPDPISLYWWRRLGSPLGILLDAANYPRSTKSQHLNSFRDIAIPYFGHSIIRQSSFMTDNGCPVELSWIWGWDGCSPSVRYSLEPLCLPSDRKADSDWNQTPSREAAGFGFWEDLSTRFQLPSELFEYFWSQLVLLPTDGSQSQAQVQSDDCSQFFAGFDIDGDGFIFKAYFLPTLRAQVQGCTRYDIIKRTLQRSPGWSAFAVAFSTLDDFVRTSSLRSQLDAEIFSLDVTSTTPSRYKLYVRCRATDFASVREVASLGGRLASADLDQSLAQLHELWIALFQPTETNDESPLQLVPHRTSGILYYFEMFAGRAASTPKIYLPVRHYASNDKHVERTVEAFVTSRASAAGKNATQATRQFRKALRQMNQNRTFDTTRGMHTYIGCTLERGTLKLISYLNPGFAQS